jgi:ferredoxin
MRAIVDRDLREGHAQSEIAAPHLFTINDDGDLVVHDETPPESERAAREQAVRCCPTPALSVSD